MPRNAAQTERQECAVEIRLLGEISFADCLALQNRLVFEASGWIEPRIIVLIAEHPRLITVGRSGSRGHVRLDARQLEREGLDLRWVNRGGGCVLHAPGQLALSVVAPLGLLGWSVGSYLQRLQRSLIQTLAILQVHAEPVPGRVGVWGRSGLLAVAGVAVKHGVAMHGAYINVNPAMRLYSFVDCLVPQSGRPCERTTMGCLLAERRSAVRMPGVRSALIESLGVAFETERVHVFTGHPWLIRSVEPARDSAIRTA